MKTPHQCQNETVFFCGGVPLPVLWKSPEPVSSVTHTLQQVPFHFGEVVPF